MARKSPGFPLYCFLLFGFLPGATFAFEPKTVVPDTLSLDQFHQLDSIENAIFIPDCCNSELAVCLKKKPSCGLAEHLHVFVKWLVARKTDSRKISEEADKRYQSLVSTAKGVIDTTVFAIAGDRRAPVLITGYVSATCPICHFVARELYTAVTTGALAGKARLMVKPLGGGFANQSLTAANDMGRFWDYFIALSYVKVRVEKELIFQIADSLKIGLGSFKKRIDDPKTDSTTKASTAEANKNGVTLAPTFFINRVRYLSYKDPMWMIDAAEYKYEMMKKSR